jgi:four helix bundle protein
MDSFEELEVWSRSTRLCVALYRELRESRDWGFRDQITRSALSVPSNIAEGYERNSRKEYIQFLRIAKGSCGELRTQAHIGKEAGIFRESLAEQIRQETCELSRMLGAMISKLAR